jgi:tetratricopeptide (TPR) repeat protein
MATQPISGRVLGHYRLIERIGEGGMGIVYRAYDEHLQREIAVKLLPASVVRDESARRRFRKEALTLARLNHPNIETLHGFEADGDVDFLVMEYVPGITLASKLARGPMRESELLEYATQLASALEEAHKQGVIHRDLKPGNIIINPSGQLKILDFGLARLLNPGDDSATDTGNLTVAGTLPYVSPEELSGSPTLDSRSDLYSCGVVLYEMATGKRPHNETSVAALLAAILHREPASVRSLNPAISPELEAIIRKAMDKDAALRYQSARELKVDLQRLVSGRKLESWPAPARVTSRRRWLTPLLIALLALAVGLELFTLRGKLGRSAAPTAPRVVAVLPFDAIGGNRDNQALCRGLTDLLTTRLTQISKQYGVEVVPASEVRTQNVGSVGDAQKKLGVSLVVEGSWDFAGNQIMYSLVNAQSRRNVSAEYVRADVSNLLGVERQVTDSLLTMLAGELRPAVESHPEARKPLPSDTSDHSSAHPDAYQYYVRGVGYLLEYQNADSLQSAIALFRAALDRDPDFALAYAGTAEAYWRLFQESKDQKWIPKALDAGHRAAELNDKLAPVHATLGLIYQGQGKYDDAVKEFQRALELDPTSDAAYRGLAGSYEAAGKNAEAESAYRRAIEMRKDYWGGYSALGAFYAKSARYDDAAAQFRRVIELAPENVRGYSNLGGIYAFQGKQRLAEETLQKSLSIEPNYRAYANLATMYFEQGRYSDSARMFEKALQLNDHDARVWRNLGDAYYWTPGEREKAAPAYKRAAELLDAQRKINPQDANLMTELALCDSMLGNLTQAIALMRQAQSRAPSDPEIMFRTAEIYEQSGDHATALNWLGRAARAGYSAADIQHDPTFQGIRTDSRYQQILQESPAQPPAK